MLLLAHGLVAVGGALFPLTDLVRWCIVTVLFFPIYRLLHRAWGVRLVNRLFTRTSLTRYWRRLSGTGREARGIRAAEVRTARATCWSRQPSPLRAWARPRAPQPLSTASASSVRPSRRHSVTAQARASRARSGKPATAAARAAIA